MVIDVFQDTVCPWCRIGKKQLELALARWTGEAVMVRYHPYFLDETIPAEGRDFRAHMAAKSGGRMRLEQFFDAPRHAGAQVGLTFNFEAIERAPNTLLSHRLVMLTPDETKSAMLDAIYKAYFEEGQDIGKLDTLIITGAQHGWDADDLSTQLASDAGTDEVWAEVNQARQLGITGVPFFVFNNRLALSGAHPFTVILQAMEQALQYSAE